MSTKKKLRLVSNGLAWGTQLLDENDNPVLDGHIRAFAWQFRANDDPVLVLELCDVGLDVEVDLMTDETTEMVFVARQRTFESAGRDRYYLQKEPIDGKKENEDQSAGSSREG